MRRRRAALIAAVAIAQLSIFLELGRGILEGRFPVESVPDHAVMAPHHFTYAVIGAGLIALLVWDDHPKREPIVVVGALAVAYFGFIHVWKWYAVTGAALVLLGLAGASGGLLRPKWDDWSLRVRLGVAVCVLAAYDDAISHAFGLWTPLDAFWKAYMVPVIA